VAILELRPGSIGGTEIPQGLEGLVACTPDGIRLRGDDTGRCVLYASVRAKEVLIGLDLSEILEALAGRGAPPTISRESLSFFLHDGQVPYPRTLYEDVFALTVGDRCRVAEDAAGFSATFSLEFPYLAALSRQSEDPDPDRLLSLLTTATVDLLEGVEGAFLLLSSGKDSTALALALAESGRRDVVCLTYAGEGDDEYLFAADVCRRLGLTHRVYSMDSADVDVARALRRFFAESPLPAGDLAQIPVVLAMARECGRAGTVLEGTGNDLTFGYVPRRKDRRAARLTLGRFRPAVRLRSLVPPGSQLNYLLRDPVEINWPGLRLRNHETSELLGGTYDTAAHWREVRRRLGAMDPVDARGLLRGRHFEIGSQKEKVDLAARAFGCNAVHPYQDPRVIDYYFNLPESSRYDARRLVNKVLLRELLRSRLAYDERSVGNRGFTFDGSAFVRRYGELIRDEVLTCSLFNTAAAERILRAVNRLDRGPFVWHHIVALFQFAAWHNHSRFVPR
jgi:asparagine synthase (glutamine-hydrolysing)